MLTAFLCLLGLFAQQEEIPLISDDEAVQYVEAHPEIIEFAANREEEPLTVTVDAWLTSQPKNYSGIIKRIRDRRRPKEDVESDKGGILDRIHERKIENKKARVEINKSKAEKRKGFLYLAIGVGIFAVVFLVVAGRVATMFGSA